MGLITTYSVEIVFWSVELPRRVWRGVETCWSSTVLYILVRRISRGDVNGTHKLVRPRALMSGSDPSNPAFFTNVRDVSLLMAPCEKRLLGGADNPVFSRSNVFRDVKFEKLDGKEPPAENV